MRSLLITCLLTLAACSPPPAGVPNAPASRPAKTLTGDLTLAKPAHEQVFANGKPSDRVEFKKTEQGEVAHGSYSSWWPNGQLATQGEYSDGQQHGAWLGWYPNGRPEFEAHFDLGVLNGVWREWRENGSPITDGGYESGRRNGLWREYDTHGALIAQTRYENGEARGLTYGPGLLTRTEIDATGGRRVFTFRRQPQGEIVRDGSYATWHPSQTKHEEGRYAADRPVGPWRVWHENGKKMFEGAYDEKGELNGPSMTWYTNGMLDSEGCFLHGMKDGFWWHRDAMTCEVTTSNFLAGELHGPFVVKSPEGEVLRMGTYSAGEPIGRWFERVDGKWVVSEFSHEGTSFEVFENGRVKARGRLVDGKREGSWIDYYPGGARARQAEFRSGVLHGAAKGWFEDGRRWREAQYTEGLRTGEATQWDEENLAFLRGAWDEETQIGTWSLHDWLGHELKNYRLEGREFVDLAVACDGEHLWRSLPWPDGKTESRWRVCLVAGREIRDGEIRSFHANGKPALIGQYYRGRASSKWSYFDNEGKLGTCVSYTQGDHNSPFTEYYPNGSVRLRGEWRRSERVSFRLILSKAADTEQTPAALPLAWNDWSPAFSVRQGRWDWLDQSGNLIKTHDYENGRVSPR